MTMLLRVEGDAAEAAAAAAAAINRLGRRCNALAPLQHDFVDVHKLNWF
jgi:hypothetical protein